MKFIEAKCACKDENEARIIANLLLDKKLVSCAQIEKIESHYVWQDERVSAIEFVIIAKTKRKLFKKIECAIKENHSYQVPEISATQIVHGSKDFLNWIKENTL